LPPHPGVDSLAKAAMPTSYERLRRLSAVAAALGAATVAGHSAGDQGVHYVIQALRSRRLGEYDNMGPMTLELRGDLVTTQHWYTDVMLGTPSQVLPVLVHTGSSFLTVPCEETCGHRCSPYEHQQFSTRASRSAIVMGVDRCPAFAPPSASTCQWSRDFALESRATAALTQDIVFGRSNNFVTFGCYTQTTGDLLEATVSGVLGLAPGLPADMARGSYGGFAQELLEHFQNKAFSISMGKEGGRLVFGDEIPSGSVAQIALDATPGAYSPVLLGMTSRTLPSFKLHASNFGGRAIVDSSESLARFPGPTAQRLYDVMESTCQVIAGCRRATSPSNCFIIPNGKDPSRHFPSLTFVFEAVGGGEAHVHWEPEDYLSKNAATLWCSGFDSHEADETILGAAWLVGRKVTFVLESPMHIATEGETRVSWTQRINRRYVAAALLLVIGVLLVVAACTMRTGKDAAQYHDVPFSPHAFPPQNLPVYAPQLQMVQQAGPWHKW